MQVQIQIQIHGGLEVMGSRDGIMTTESPSAALGNLPHTRPQGPSTPRTNNARKMQVQIQNTDTITNTRPPGAVKAGHQLL